MTRRRLVIAAGAAGLPWIAGRNVGATDIQMSRTAEWPRTDFSRHSVDYSEIISGGPPKDGIPAINAPAFAAPGVSTGLSPRESVISVYLAAEARAYPLRVLIWHEIVNDVIGTTPITVTWCPLCNSTIVFDRRVDGETLSFGTTGKLRFSDLVMYDRQTESWWQQALGECIVGAKLGAQLAPLPARVESVERFHARFPRGRILLPPSAIRRAYGRNPYAGYDRAAQPFLYRGTYNGPLPPLTRVVVVDNDAWPLSLLMQRRRIDAGDLTLSWEPGQSSPLDAPDIDAGQEIGNVIVQRQRGDRLEDVVYDVSFAFAFRAFHPHGSLHQK